MVLTPITGPATSRLKIESLYKAYLRECGETESQEEAPGEEERMAPHAAEGGLLAADVPPEDAGVMPHKSQREIGHMVDDERGANVGRSITHRSGTAQAGEGSMFDKRSSLVVANRPAHFDGAARAPHRPRGRRGEHLAAEVALLRGAGGVEDASVRHVEVRRAARHAARVENWRRAGRSPCRRTSSDNIISSRRGE